MKVFGIGLNYLDHVKEFGNRDVPTKPVVFSKPETALLKNNTAFYYPSFSNDIHYEVEIVIRISKEGKYIAEEFAGRYFDALAIGIDFTARDLQNELKKNGHPWDIAKGFNGSAPISDFVSLSEIANIHQLPFSLYKNGVIAQEGNTKDMIFSFEEIISYLSQFFTLKKGDLIFTGTPVGVGAIKIGDVLEACIENKKMLTCEIK